MDDYTSGFCIRASQGRGAAATTGTKCGRWNPTTEQVKVLTELFRSGLRTPSTDQIQKISSQLSFYGKIESKNVFYWFQNHKARERQKRRRVLADDGADYAHPHDCNHKFSSTKHFGETNNVVSEPDRVIETLQLFPVNSNFGESYHHHHHHSEKLRIICRDDCKENSSYNTCIIGSDNPMDHPTLDLRLSFI